MIQRFTTVTCLILALSTFAQSARAAESNRPRLLNYQQIMLLNKEKRVQYLRQMSTLLTLLENQQRKYEIAGQYQEMKSQVAELIRQMKLLPEAAAATESIANSIYPVWNPVAKSWECSRKDLATFDTRVGTCVLVITNGSKRSTDWTRGECPSGGKVLTSYDTNWYFWHPYDICVPKESWSRLSKDRQEALSAGSFLPSGYFYGKSKMETESAVSTSVSPVVDSSGKKVRVIPERPQAIAMKGTQEEGVATPASQPPTDAATPAPTSPATPMDSAAAPKVDQCAPPSDLACKNLDAKTRKGLIAKFRKSASRASCISGGFFSKYNHGVNRVGNCHILSKVTYHSTNELSCGPSQALCNPLIFCQGVKLDYNSDKGAVHAFIPSAVCVPRNQDITKNCEDRFQSAMGKNLNMEGLKQELSDAKRSDLIKVMSEQKVRACDPATDLKDLPFHEEYDGLIKEIKGDYDRLCSKDQGFQALFCTECEIIGQHIYNMAKDATGSGCASNVKTEKPSAEPPTKGSPKSTQ